MSIRLYYPIGPDSEEVSDPDKVEGIINFLVSNIRLVPDSFGKSHFDGDHPYLDYLCTDFFSLSSALTESRLRKIICPWDGILIDKADALTIQVSSEYKRLLSANLEERNIAGFVPTYFKITSGNLAIHSSQDSCTEVKAGEVFGSLTGNDIRISFLDEEENFINPFYFYSLFQDLLPDKDILTLGNPFRDQEKIVPHLSGKNEIEPGELFITISGGTRQFLIANPPPVVHPRYFSFLWQPTETLASKVSRNWGPICRSEREESVVTIFFSNDSDIATDYSLKLQIKDNPAFIQADYISDIEEIYYLPVISLTISDHILPLIKKYTKANGSRSPSNPLRIKASISCNNTYFFDFEIGQDTIDIIRQEYVFHCVPPNPRGGKRICLPVPAREEIIQLNNGDHSGMQFPELYKQLFKNNNYTNKNTNITLGNKKVFARLLDFFQSRYRTAIRNMIQEGIIPNYITSELTVNSSWRNPERNEAVGGVINSNHQFGDAFDITAVQKLRYSDYYSPYLLDALGVGPPEPSVSSDLDQLRNRIVHNLNMTNRFLMSNLFALGHDYLMELKSAADQLESEGFNKYFSTELLLEHNTDILITKKFAENSSTPGDLKRNLYEKYEDSLYNRPDDLPEAEYLVNKVSGESTHVHVGWGYKKDSSNDNRRKHQTIISQISNDHSFFAPDPVQAEPLPSELSRNLILYGKYDQNLLAQKNINMEALVNTLGRSFSEAEIKKVTFADELVDHLGALSITTPKINNLVFVGLYKDTQAVINSNCFNYYYYDQSKNIRFCSLYSSIMNNRGYTKTKKGTTVPTWALSSFRSMFNLSYIDQQVVPHVFSSSLFTGLHQEVKINLDLALSNIPNITILLLNVNDNPVTSFKTLLNSKKTEFKIFYGDKKKDQIKKKMKIMSISPAMTVFDEDYNPIFPPYEGLPAEANAIVIPDNLNESEKNELRPNQVRFQTDNKFDSMKYYTYLFSGKWKTKKISK